LNKAQADLEDAQVTAVIAIDQMTQTGMDGTTTDRDQPDIQESHCQGKARQS
jgi:hypothetical protein